MAESNINVTPGSGGPNIDLFLVDNGNARQSVTIGSSTTGANVANVDSVEGLYSLPRRDIPASRSRLVLNAENQASVIAEAMMTFQSYRSGIVTSGITSYTVTTGKTFRITHIAIKIRPTTPSTTATAGTTTVLRFREGNVITSPLIASFVGMMEVTADSNPLAMAIPDGLEFPSGTILGMSHLASATGISESFTIIGYEY